MRLHLHLLALLPALCFSSLALAQAAPVRAPAASARAGQFSAEAAAQAHCPADSVVWVNRESKATHVAGSKYYGKTKSGAYMCRKEADAAGFHAPRARNTAAAQPKPGGSTSR